MKTNQLPAEALAYVEDFLRNMGTLGCSVFGIIACDKPNLNVALMRNTDGDPVKQAEILLAIIKGAATDGRLTKHTMPPLA